MSYLTTSDGIKLFYYDSKKDAPTILFIHGLKITFERMKPFMEEFQEKYRIVFYSQRGHDKSDANTLHMNVKRLGQDLNDVIEQLKLKDVILIGHSLGASTIFSYVDQFGCDKIKAIVPIDMSPCCKNLPDWQGGLGQGKWTEEDFLADMDRMFDDIGYGSYYVLKEITNPKYRDLPEEKIPETIAALRGTLSPYTMVSFWWSLYRVDYRETISKITVPFFYIMPEFPLYNMVVVNFYKDHVKGEFGYAHDFPGTTHNIVFETPKELANAIKAFLEK